MPQDNRIPLLSYNQISVLSALYPTHNKPREPCYTEDHGSQLPKDGKTTYFDSPNLHPVAGNLPHIFLLRKDHKLEH
jgi:hypothetical protein